MKKRVVLVLEDEALISLDLELTLAEAGFAVLVARSCKEATEFLADHPPDVAVLDVHVADGDCVSVAEHLFDQKVPFIVLRDCSQKTAI